MQRKIKKQISAVNLILILVNIVYFLFIESIGSTLDTELMIRCGASYSDYIYNNGEYYRLVTSMFMHFGISHIANNMFILFLIGDNLERAMGRWKYFILYMIGGVGSSFVSSYMGLDADIQKVGAGASGAIFAVMGALIYVLLVNKGRLEDLTANRMIFMVLIMLYYGFTSQGVDNVAHVSGMIIGFIFAIILYRKKPKSDDENIGHIYGCRY